MLAGHSLGGYVAATYAATYPHRLDGLVILGAAAVPRGAGAAHTERSPSSPNEPAPTG